MAVLLLRQFLAFSRKFIRVLGSSLTFSDLREKMVELVLSKAVREYAIEYRLTKPLYYRV
jgi:hypothetical protein